MHTTIIDNCAVNRFAAINLDPFKALTGSAFFPGATPQLLVEYRRGASHPRVAPHVRALLRRLIDECVLLDAPDAKSLEDTDGGLVALCETHIVITMDTKSPWDRLRDAPGLVLWPVLEAHLRQGATFATFLEARIALMDR